MKKALFLVTAIACLSSFAAGVDLVKDGKPTAEIVLSDSAGPSVKTAATELQRHLEAMSGVKLLIVNAPTAGVENHVYVGESEHTRKLGITLGEIKEDGFVILADKDYVVLAGKEIDNSSVFASWSKAKIGGNRQTAWEKYSGRNWRFPPIHNNGEWSEELGFHGYDGTGALYAVYELLEQLGMRWYMPVKDLGIVYPDLESIRIENQNLKKEPEFGQRLFADCSTGEFREEFLWYKSMKAGSSFIMPIYHSLSGPLLKARMAQDQQPKEYYGIVNGETAYYVPKLNSERLRSDFIDYLELVDKTFPGLPYTCIGQPDGWIVLDSTDEAAGWNKKAERGASGSFSDYFWDFALDIRKRYMEKSPDSKFTVMAYGYTRRPPTNVEMIPKNMAVVFCQAAQNWLLENRTYEDRSEWLQKLRDSGADKNQFMIWEYYLGHADRYAFPPVPIIFTEQMCRSFRDLYDHCAGFTVEVGWASAKNRKLAQLGLSRPGLSHLMLYLHNRLCWDRDLDVQAMLDEYYELFFGPAKSEMKAFHEFAEAIWNRPEPRTMTATGGFLKEADIAAYFDILKRAREKAGDTLYGKRIDFIAAEMEPLKILHEKLKRTGPDVRCYAATSAPVIDGDLEKPFWSEVQGFYTLRDMITGETPSHLSTSAALRWYGSSLVVGVQCVEPKMKSLRSGCTERDSVNIFSDDTVEILLETPQGTRLKIVVNPAGTILDLAVTSNVADLPEFYTVKRVAVKQYADRWTVEAEIDASGLDAERPSKFFPWGVNICRQRMAGNEVEAYMLSPSGSSFKDLQCMGNLIMRK